MEMLGVGWGGSGGVGGFGGFWGMKKGGEV